MAQKMDLNSFYQGLDKMYETHDYQKTEEYLVENLKAAQEEVNTPLMIAVSNELAGLYRAGGKVEEALVLNNSVIEALKAIGQNQNENYATALMNTANSYNSVKQFDKALELYTEALALMEKLGLDKDYRMAALTNNLSSCYREEGNLEMAEEMARRSIVIISDIPNSRLDLATSLINLGEVQTRLGKYEEAEQSLTTAISIYEKDAGGHDVHYAPAVAALGNMNYNRKNYAAAEENYKKALELSERDFGRSAYYELVERNLKTVEAEMK